MHAVITKRNKPVTSTRWTGKWSNGVPTPTTNAYIDTDYTTATGSFACRDLIVTASAVLTIPENTYVKVLKDINQTTTSHIIVKAGGELMLLNVDADVTSARLTAEATYKNLQRLDYAFISSPISGIPVKRLSPGTLDNRFYKYNEETDQFNTVNPNTKSMLSGEGFHIRTPANHPTVANNFNLSVDNLTGGFINKGIFSIPIFNRKNGYNQIGNPYNSRLSLRKFYHTNKNLIDNYIYIWENRSNGAPGSAYTVYNTYTNNIDIKSINLLPFQSFIIRSRNKNIIENITFSPDMIITDIDFTLPDRFYLNIFENTYNLPIGGFCYDIKKYKSIFTNNYTPGAIYIKSNNNTVIHQDTENSLQRTLNVGLNLNIYSTYRISIKNLSGLFSGLPTVNLHDALTGIIHNLKTSDYTFTSAAGTFENRFSITFQ